MSDDGWTWDEMPFARAGLLLEYRELKQQRDALRAEVERLRAALHALYGQVEQARVGFGVYHDSPSMAQAMHGAMSALQIGVPGPTSAQCSHATVIVVGDQETCQDCGRARRRTTIRTSAALPERIDLKRFQKAPCYICGYNGPNYYQPEVHECAGLYHEQTNEMP